MNKLIIGVKRLMLSFMVSPALRSSFIYILISIVYVFLSDHLVHILIKDLIMVKFISIYKGWAFVIFSGFYIYWLLTRKKQEPSTVEEKFQLLAELTFEGIVLHNNGIAIDCNNAFQNITGYSRDELVGENIIDLLLDDKNKSIFNSAIKQEQKLLSQEVLINTKNGSSLWAEISGKTVMYQGTKVRVTSFRDITARKRAEKAKAISEKQLTTIFNSTPLLMMILDTDGKILKANQTSLNLSGKSALDVVGLYPGQIINCGNDNGLRLCGSSSYCDNCTLNSLIKQTLSTRESCYKYEAKLIMGETDNVFERNTLISTLYLDVDETPIVLVGIDDITERVQMENILREKNTILLKAQQIAKVGEFSFDVKTKTFKFSDNLANIIGANRTITLDEWYNSIHSEDREETRTFVQHALQSLSHYSHLYKRYKSSGELQYLLTIAEVERDENGAAKRVFGVTSDITDQKKVEIDLQMMNYELQTAEEELRATNEELVSTNEALRDNVNKLDEARRKAEESDRLKSAFLANMSHEIRTPMNAIMGFSDILDMEDMPFDKRKLFTKTIRQRAKDLLTIINDILDIARIESQTLRIIERKGNLSDTLSEISEFFQIRGNELSPKSINFEMRNELVNEQNNIQTDFDRLKQVLINLIDNAYKYTPKGEIIVGCKLIDNSLQFSVRDTGIGISKDNLELIFERFRQVDESYLAREYGGTGLGLTICKGIVNLLGGNMWVESEKEKGSTFYFSIPYKPIGDINDKEKNVTVPRFDFSGKTILIVEDVDYNMDYLLELFKSTNVNLLTATNGSIAIEQFRQNQNIAIVLMDIRLPDTNGFDLTKQMIKERKDLKVIAQTAYASEEDRIKCFEAGCVDFVTKPISKANLFETINRFI
ncbi:MAG: PAS domain S-box protein [Bacteroidales bacterium]